MTAKINKVSTDLDESRAKLVQVNTTMLSSAERAAAIELLINDEQRHTHIINMDSEKIQGVLYRNQVRLQELKNVMKNCETEISGCEIGTRMLEKRCKSKLADLQVQKELIYSLVRRSKRIDQFFRDL